MKIPKLRLVLLTFLPSVFSCFVITACTPEQPKRNVDSVTPTAKAKLTPTPEPTATPAPTETPTPTYTSTPSNPNRGSTEGESLIANSDTKRKSQGESLIANSDTKRKSRGESLIANSDAKSRSDKSKDLVTIPEMVQNVVNALHQKIQNGEIDLAKENNLNIQEINISTTGGGYPYPKGFNPLGDMIYIENVNTKDLIVLKWIKSANGYELSGYFFPSRNIKFNCPSYCPMYYPQ